MDNKQTKHKPAVSEEFERALNSLHYAIVLGMYDEVRNVISQYCTSINIRTLLAYPNEDYWMCTALELAVRHHHKENCNCRTRMNAGLDPCQQFIVYPDKKRIVEFLLENGADPHARNVYGLTAIQYAIEPNLYFSNPAPETKSTILRFLALRPRTAKKQPFKTR